MDKKVLNHLKKDTILKSLIENIDLKEIIQNKDVFATLVNSIISQQLSSKAAGTIFFRFINLFKPDFIIPTQEQWNDPIDRKMFPTPQEILNTDDEILRKVGMSYSKVKYIKNICIAEIENEIKYEYLQSMNDEDTIKHLVKIKGVGKWTAEMILMFSLNREDVLPIDDLIIRNTIIKLYNLEGTPKEQNSKVIEVANKWSPYRTTACYYLWQYVDGAKK